MMNDPHVATLGAQLSSLIRQIKTNTPPQTKLAESLLVPLRTVRHDRGSVFCVPGAGGSAASFASIADALCGERQIYGFQPRGLYGLEVPHSTVPAAADAYLKSLEEKYAEGSVHLLGHSFGGWVAFEMALRLEATGRPPASLTLIDSGVPTDEHGRSREYTRAETLMKLVEIWEMVAECPLDVAREALEVLQASEQLSLLHDRLMRVGLMSARSKPDALIGSIRTFATALRTAYLPKAKYRGAMNLVLLSHFKLDDRTQEQKFAESVVGWRSWAPNLDAWHGPGNHMTALKLPHVRKLADWLDAKLRGATPLRQNYRGRMLGTINYPQPRFRE